MKYKCGWHAWYWILEFLVGSYMLFGSVIMLTFKLMSGDKQLVWPIVIFGFAASMSIFFMAVIFFIENRREKKRLPLIEEEERLMEEYKKRVWQEPQQQ